MIMDTYYILKTYTDQLVNIFEKPIYKIIIELFEESVFLGNSQQNEENETILSIFQKKINDIKKWNNDLIKQKYNNIDKEIINEKLLNDLIETIFKLQNQFLSKKLNHNITIPSNINIFYKSLKNAASKIYETPFIVDINGKDEITKYKYNEKMNKIIHDAILSTIQMCGINDILGSKSNEESEESEEEPDQKPVGDMGELEKMEVLSKKSDNKTSRKSSRAVSVKSEPFENFFEEPEIKKEKIEDELIKVNIK